jgi:glycosyltransferase involved in cell wall biosynthesis
MQNELLPLHFFTIVIDGEPFIRHHLDVFDKLDIPWHWHIVEGVAALTRDTSWSLKTGGHIPESHKRGLSNDGTTQYLDQIAKRYPNNITLYRKEEGLIWDGKLEMVRAPIENINRTHQQSCLLWQIDVDELWTLDQIKTCHKLFIDNPNRFSAWFWCHYFVGPDKVVTTRNCYSQNPEQEWLRVWRFYPGMDWVSHEPPLLVFKTDNGVNVDVGRLNPFTHAETEQHGLIFQHFSYLLESQVKFKESYYGYSEALNRWHLLQADENRYSLLRDFFPWVKDSTLVTSSKRRGISPIFSISTNQSGIVTIDSTAKTEEISQEQKVKFETKQKKNRESYRVAIDGVFFQHMSTGIARLWISYLEAWRQLGYNSDILLLDRDGTMPKIEGYDYLKIQRHRMGQGEGDRADLKKVCEMYKIRLFCSTYYTSLDQENLITNSHSLNSSCKTQTLQIVYDMIPEVLKWDVTTNPMWIEKKLAFERANYFVCISANTKTDLHRFYPHIPPDKCEIIHPGVDKDRFKRPTQDSINKFRETYSINRPFFLLVGSGAGYKNGKMLIEAISLLPSKQAFEIIIATRDGLNNELKECSEHLNVRALPLTDSELCAAYSEAVALVYPSIYEGFGLPILEAMACDCPVISNLNSSLHEVGGESVLYATTQTELANALCDVQKPAVREAMITSGRKRFSKFCWTESAIRLWNTIQILTDKEDPLPSLIQIQDADREELNLER